jgi:DNA gyrase/topoisomerase IV subunit A
MSSAPSSKAVYEMRAIKSSSVTPGLMAAFTMSQIQAQAILDMQLRRLANLEQQKILDEYAEVVKTIAYLEDLLANPKRMLPLIKEEIEGHQHRDDRHDSNDQAGCVGQCLIG